MVKARTIRIIIAVLLVALIGYLHMDVITAAVFSGEQQARSSSLQRNPDGVNVREDTRTFENYADTFKGYLFGNNKYDTTMPFRLHIPDGYDAAKSYPVLLYLHGAGERATDNDYHMAEKNTGIIARALSEGEDTIIIAPQCPPEVWWYRDSGADNLLGEVMDILDWVKSNYNCDGNRLYVTGISMGGYATWALLSNYPDTFAAAMPVCGGGDPDAVEAFKTVPIWTAHGGSDGTVPVKETRAMVEALKEVGGNVRYDEYFLEGHDSWKKFYRTEELISWMYAQKRV